MEILRYIGQIFRYAIQSSFGKADTIAGFTSAVLYGIAKLYKVESIMAIDWWWLPLIILGAVFAIRLVLSPYWLYKKVKKERDELLGIPSTNGVIVLKHDPALFIEIQTIDFGQSGDSGYPPCNSNEHKARWIRLGMLFKGNVFIETLELVISGKAPISAFEWAPGHVAYYHYFQIPEWVKSGEERTIQVRTFANGVKWGSPEKSINFPKL